MKKLMLGLMMAFVANVVIAEQQVTVDNLVFELINGTRARLIGSTDDSPLTEINVAEIEYLGGRLLVTEVGDSALEGRGKLTSVSLPNVTKIGESAFACCTALTSVSLPNVTTIGGLAFSECCLTSVSLPSATTIGPYAFSDCCCLTLVSLPKATAIDIYAFAFCSSIETVVLSWELLANQDRERWGLPEETKLVGPNSKEEVQNAKIGSVRWMIGETPLENQTYEIACAHYGVAWKDAQVIGGDDIVVKKESITAANAETISIVNNEVQLGVSVLSNSNITAEIANWGKVKFTKDTKVTLNEDGTKLIISIPVSTQQGFIILQSGEGKAVPSDAVPHSPIALPIFDPEIR